MNPKYKRVSILLVHFVLLWSVQDARANMEYSGNDGANPDLGVDGSFSWEELLKRSVEFQGVPLGEQQSTDPTRQFLAEFGATLDHCNKRIEEAAVVSEYMIKHFMATVVNRTPGDQVDEEYLDRLIDANEIINEKLDIPYDDINVRLLNSNSNFWPSLLNVLRVLAEACDDLPVQIVESDIAARQEQNRHQTVLDDIVSAMTRWTAQWSEKVKAYASVFLEDCIAVENCESNLRLIMDVLGQSLEESLRSNSRVEALLRSYAKDKQNAVRIENTEDSGEPSVRDGLVINELENTDEEAVMSDTSSLNDREKSIISNTNRIHGDKMSASKDKNSVTSADVQRSGNTNQQDEDNSLESGSENSIGSKLRFMFRDLSEFFGYNPPDSEATDSDIEDESSISQNDVSVQSNQPTQRQPNFNARTTDNERSMGLLARADHSEQIKTQSASYGGSLRRSSDDESEQQAPRFSHGGRRLLRLISASLSVLQLPWQSRQAGKVVLEINGDEVVNNIPAEFLSFALESQLIQKPGETFDTKSTKLRRLMEPLKNAVFRLGGSSANFLFFDPDDGHSTSTEEAPKRTSPTNKDTWRSPFSTVSNHGPWQPHQQPMFSRLPASGKRVSWQRDNPESNGISLSKALAPMEGTLPKTHPKLLRTKKTEWSSNGINTPAVHPKFHKSQHLHDETQEDRDESSELSRTRRSLPVGKDHHPKLSRKTWGHFRSPYDPRLITSSERDALEFHNFTLTNTDLRNLLNLCRALNWTLLFDLNQFIRDGFGGWDPNNARLIVAAAADADANVIWQLGNEPNNYAHKFPFSINGTQMARDVERLKGILATATPGSVSLVGPDVTRPQFHATLGGREWESCDSGRHASHTGQKLETDSVEFLQEFLEARSGLVDAISWHQYYLCGRTATVSDFLSPSTMDLFPRQLGAVLRVRDELSPGTPIWITETGSAYGGGAPGLSNRFAGSFLWLDKLGVAAEGGVQVVARQSIFGGNYALLDHNYDPNPDYWVSVLHKQLVGTRVLHVTSLGSPATLRLYAHCMQHDHALYRPGSLVVYGVNAGEQEAGLMVVGAPADAPALEYILTPALGDLTARDVLLNGIPLEVGPDGSLPDLLPLEKTVQQLRMPPHSLGFWVLRESGVAACI